MSSHSRSWRMGVRPHVAAVPSDTEAMLLLQRRNREEPLMGNVLHELFKSPADTRASREDRMALLSIAGRVIGHTRDGKRAYVVYDGRVWLADDPSPGSSVEYFEFCERVRRYTDVDPRVPMAGVMDFVPQPGFHLGWPRPQGEQNGPQPGGLVQPMAMNAAAPRPKNPEPSSPWVIFNVNGHWVHGFDNIRAEAVMTTDPNTAKRFDSRTEAESWRQRYCTAVDCRVMPLS